MRRHHSTKTRLLLLNLVLIPTSSSSHPTSSSSHQRLWLGTRAEGASATLMLATSSTPGGVFSRRYKTCLAAVPSPAHQDLLSPGGSEQRCLSSGTLYSSASCDAGSRVAPLARREMSALSAGADDDDAVCILFRENSTSSVPYDTPTALSRGVE